MAAIPVVGVRKLDAVRQLDRRYARVYIGFYGKQLVCYHTSMMLKADRNLARHATTS
jgi:hypothetical protein